MNIIAGFIIMVTAFWMSEGDYSLSNIAWFLFGIAIIARNQIKQLIIYFWEEHARKRHIE